MRHFAKSSRKWTHIAHFCRNLVIVAGLFGANAVRAEDKALVDGEKTAGEKPTIKKISEDEFETGKIRFNKKTREVRLPAVVNLNLQTVLEFALVNSKMGKLHESLLATEVRPFDLQIVMKLLKYVPSERALYPDYDEEGNPILPMKTDALGGVSVMVTWKDAEGKESTVPIEDWIMNEQEKAPMTHDAWIYTGSEVVDGNYLPELEGSILAVYRTQGAMFSAFAKGSDNDEVWFPRQEVVPPVGTPVEVTIKPREVAPEKAPDSQEKKP